MNLFKNPVFISLIISFLFLAFDTVNDQVFYLSIFNVILSSLILEIQYSSL